MQLSHCSVQNGRPLTIRIADTGQPCAQSPQALQREVDGFKKEYPWLLALKHPE